MGGKKSSKSDKRRAGRNTGKASAGFTAEEREAMKARAREMKAEARANESRASGDSDVLAAIAKVSEPERTMARRLHDLVKDSAPQLAPKTWYGMPAYADKDGKVVCFFRPAEKFKDRYATFGFNDKARLDDGNMWPTSFALKKLTTAEEKQIAALVRKAVGK
ncbi:MAG: iron chaperone [Rhodanobacteraceae bacterium]